MQGKQRQLTEKRIKEMNQAELSYITLEQFLQCRSNGITEAVDCYVLYQ